MLTEYSLDTENFQDIMEEAKNMVVSLYPEWTDFNYHDPGIMLLELFSWIKEGQQYYLDQIGSEHKKKYLKLLGMNIRHKRMADAYAHISAEDELTILEGTMFSAGEVPFEVVHRQCIVDNRVVQCFSAGKTIEQAATGNYEHLKLYVFGKEPCPGMSFYIGFDKPLPVGERVGLMLKLTNELNYKRNKLDKALKNPIFHLKYEYYTEAGWIEIEKLEDQTYGMLQNGMLYMTLEQRHMVCKLFDRVACYIRVRVVACDVDLSPVLQKVKLNVLPLKQKSTLAGCEEVQAVREGDVLVVKSDNILCIEGENHLYSKRDDIYYPIDKVEKKIDEIKGQVVFSFSGEESGESWEDETELLIVSYSPYVKLQKCLGIGNGFPYQEYDLESEDFDVEGIQILVHEIGSGNGYVRWDRVDDFGGSKSTDRHFAVDVAEGKILFGDCEHGMAPEGDILLIAYSKTLGEQGNVKSGTICSLTHAQGENIVICNEEDAENGLDEETVEECFYRGRKMLKHPLTAITNADYERYVMETPGIMIDSCKVLPSIQNRTRGNLREENKLTIVVKPVSTKEKCNLSETYKKNILDYLEQYRSIGTDIQLIEPRYIPVEVCVDLVVKPHFVRAREQIADIIEGYFSGLKREFGAEIIYSELYGILDMLECVEEINDITLDIRDGKVKHSQDGNYKIPANGVIELKNIQYIISLAG